MQYQVLIWFLSFFIEFWKQFPFIVVPNHNVWNLWNLISLTFQDLSLFLYILWVIHDNKLLISPHIQLKFLHMFHIKIFKCLLIMTFLFLFLVLLICMSLLFIFLILKFFLIDFSTFLNTFDHLVSLNFFLLSHHI
jgi:hypothetical protein